jgi:hypothetical protein
MPVSLLLIPLLFPFPLFLIVAVDFMYACTFLLTTLTLRSQFDVMKLHTYFVVRTEIRRSRSDDAQCLLTCDYIRYAKG